MTDDPFIFVLAFTLGIGCGLLLAALVVHMRYASLERLERMHDRMIEQKLRADAAEAINHVLRSTGNRR